MKSGGHQVTSWVFPPRGEKDRRQNHEKLSCSINLHVLYIQNQEGWFDQTGPGITWVSTVTPIYPGRGCRGSSLARKHPEAVKGFYKIPWPLITFNILCMTVPDICHSPGLKPLNGLLSQSGSRVFQTSPESNFVQIHFHSAKGKKKTNTSPFQLLIELKATGGGRIEIIYAC